MQTRNVQLPKTFDKGLSVRLWCSQVPLDGLDAQVPLEKGVHLVTVVPLAPLDQQEDRVALVSRNPDSYLVILFYFYKRRGFRLKKIMQHVVLNANICCEHANVFRCHWPVRQDRRHWGHW